MNYRELHRWDLGYRDAAAVQEELRGRLILQDEGISPRLVAGVDASYQKRGELFYGGVVLYSLHPWKLVEEAAAWERVTFPYIPGLLSFREAPVILKAFTKLTRVPDLVLVDGHGIAHPRGMGIASHLGLILDLPTIGCAKSKLIGEYREPGTRRGNRTALTYKGERIGTVLRTRDGVKPVFVSTGHRIDRAGAVRWVLRCCRGYRLPEPARQAHLLVNRVRKEQENAS